MRVSKAAAVAVFVFVSLSVNAAELYVSLSGNDANAGTLAAPFRTINKASTVAQPGDVVNVRGGVYSGSAISISSRGTAAARITFRSYPGERAILDGTGLSSSTIVVNLYKTEYVDFTGFEVRNAPYIAVNARNTKSTRIADNTIHTNVRNGIYVGSDTMGATTDVLIENNTLYNNALANQAHSTSGGWPGTVVVSKTNGGTVRGNRVYNNDGEAIIALLSDSIVISGNECFDNFSQGVFLDNAQSTTVDGNLIYSTGNTRYFRDGYPGQGIAVANETYAEQNLSSDNTIINNIVIGTRWGFYYGNFETGGGLKNTRVANNTFVNAAQEILRITQDAHANSVVENNIFHQVGGLGPSVLGGGVTFRNNNWYGVVPGVAAGAGDVIGNPNFVRAGGFAAADYRVTAGSAAIGRAADLSTIVRTDYFGAPRVQPFDIGAHQYSTGAAADTQAPTAPGNLRTLGGDASSVTIGWNAATDNVGVAGYSVIRNGVTVATVATNSWTDRAMVASVLYNYQIVAFDGAGNRSAGSNVLSLAWNANEGGEPADTEAPAAPGNLRVTDRSGTSVSLAWDAATDNVGVKVYHVYQDGAHVGTTYGTAYTATMLKGGQTYSFFVVAFDDAGNRSANSSTVTAVTPKKRRAV